MYVQSLNRSTLSIDESMKPRANKKIVTLGFINL